MKKTILILFVLFGIKSFSQSPYLINYQGVARNIAGTPIINQTIGIKFELLQGSASGSVAYTEQQTVNTNSLGLFNTQIGAVNPLSGINWQNGPYFLKIGMDAAGGTSYTFLGTQQLVSVPYALYAEKSGNANDWGLTGNSGTNNTSNFIGTIDNVPFTIKVNNKISGKIDNINTNTFFGYTAGIANTSGFNNTAIGQSALSFNTTGSNNVGNGFEALLNNTTGTSNTAFGVQALYSNITGSNNTALGNAALYSAIGLNNTAIGFTAGKLATGNRNVFIGHGAGYYETGDDKLIIANSNSTTPIIQGDFSTGNVGVAGNVGVGSNVTSLNTRLTVNDGHIKSTQTVAPLITGANGTTANFWGGNSTDISGIIEIAMGATTAAGSQAVVTFNKPYNSIPMIVITPANNQYAGQAVSLNGVFVDATVSSFRIVFDTAYANPTYTMYFNYIVIEGN